MNCGFATVILSGIDLGIAELQIGKTGQSGGDWEKFIKERKVHIGL